MNAQPWDERPDLLDEHTEAWGPGSDDPIPFLPVHGPRVRYGAAPVDPALLVDWHLRGPALTDDALAGVLAAWSRAAASGDVVDHARCDGQACEQTICCCPAAAVNGTCPGTVEQACSHHGLLCSDCAVASCVDCRNDYVDDGGQP